VNEDERRIRFGSCKRNASKLPGSVADLKRCAGRFLEAHHRFESWRIEFVGIAPRIEAAQAVALAAEGVIAQSLSDLTAGL
jgi:uncharacterized protein